MLRMPDFFPRDGFGAMVAWLVGDPVRAPPPLPGRKYVLSDVDPVGEVADTTTEEPGASSGAGFGG